MEQQTQAVPAAEETKEELIERLLDGAELDYRCCGHAPLEN